MYGLMYKHIRIKDQQLISKMDKIIEIDSKYIIKVFSRKKKGDKSPYKDKILGNYE